MPNLLKYTKKAFRKIREARLFIRGLKSSRHPILAHLVPTRRCNLSCTYCNEYDRVSDPVAIEEMLRRVDQLANLGTTMVHLSGGEPLLHPQVETIIRRIRSQGMIAGLLTNGLLLNRDQIRALNRAGLDHLQISIDNVQPDEVSKKSLRVLEKKLKLLADYAHFDVNINSVLGNDLENPEDALVITRKAIELGHSNTVGVIHDHSGRLKPLARKQRKVYEEIQSFSKPLFRAPSHNRFQENMVRGLPTNWDCHAGSRYLYICEDGLVHYCSQQRGTPGIPLAEYTAEDLDREYSRVKECAPWCTISCVHRVAWLDTLREEPMAALEQFFPAPAGEAWTTSRLPVPVRLLAWAFVPRRKKAGSARLLQP